jgi:hypothetical protein
MREKMAEAQMQVAEGVVGKGAAVKKKMLEDEAKAEIKIMQETLANEQLTDKEKVALRTELANKITSLDNRMASGGGGRVSHQETTDYIADARLRIAEANGNSQKIAAIYDEEIAKLKQLVAAHKATMAQVSNAEREKVLAVNKARLDEIKEGARLEEQQQRLLKLNTSLAQMAAGTFKFAGQKEGPGAEQQRQQQYLAEAAQVHAMAQKEIADLQAIANAAGEGTTIQKEAQQEIMSVLLTSKQQEVELYKKAGDEAVAAANKLTATFTTMFDQIGTAFETFGKSLASAVLAPQQEIIKAGLGSKTISHQGDQIRAAIGQLLSSVAETIGKALMESIGKAIANSLSGGAANTIGELLSRWFTKGISGIFGGAAGEAGTKAVGSAAGGALSGAGGAGGAAALSTAGATLNTAGATLSTAGAALNTAAAALSTAGAAGGVAGGAGAAGGAAAAATAEATTISAAITAGDATIVSAIAASTTAIVSAVTAAGLNPSIAGFKFASGGIVPSAAGGMVGGMGGTLAILHAREMVLPAPISTGLQQMIARGNTGGGGGTSNTANLNFSPTVNTGPKGRGGTGMTRSEFSQMLSLHSGAMLGEARNLMRGGWRPS